MTELQELQRLRALVEKQKLELQKQQVKIEKQQEELEKKVDKVVGKNLSSEDYTKEEKEKLGNISNITEQEIIAILGG